MAAAEGSNQHPSPLQVTCGEKVSQTKHNAHPLLNETNKQTNKSQRSPAPQRPQVGDRVQQFAGLASTPDMDPTNRSQTRDLCRQPIMILATVPTVLVDMK